MVESLAPRARSESSKVRGAVPLDSLRCPRSQGWPATGEYGLAKQWCASARSRRACARDSQGRKLPASGAVAQVGPKARAKPREDRHKVDEVVVSETTASETHALFYGRKHAQTFQVMGYEGSFSQPGWRRWDRLFRTLDNDRCISDTAHVSSLSGEIL